MGSTCFLTNTLDRVNSEISLRVLALNSVMVVHTAKTDKLIGDETVSSLTRWLNVLSDLQSGKVCPVNTFMPMPRAQGRAGAVHYLPHCGGTTAWA